MRSLWLAVVVGVVLGWLPIGAEAQDAEELFRKVNPSVVVIRAKGRAVDSARGLITFTEIGSGVLISADGKVMMFSRERSLPHCLRTWVIRMATLYPYAFD